MADLLKNVFKNKAKKAKERWCNDENIPNKQGHSRSVKYIRAKSLCTHKRIKQRIKGKRLFDNKGQDTEKIF